MSLDKVVCGPRSKVSTTSNVDPSDARVSDSSTGILNVACVQVNLLHVYVAVISIALVKSSVLLCTKLLLCL